MKANQANTRRFNHNSLARSRGFSLVEVLVASTILLLVLFIGSYGYNLFARYWYQGVGEFENKFEDVKGLNILHGVIKSTRPYILRGGEKGIFHYFEGGKSVVRGFTESSVFAPNKMAFYELKVVENDKNLLDLIYSEVVVAEHPVIYERDLKPYTNKMTLLRDFNDLTFEFWGWQSYDDWVKRNLFNNQASQQWYGFYSGKDTLIPPNLVRVSITNNGKISSVDMALSHFIPAQMKTYFSGQTDA